MKKVSVLAFILIYFITTGNNLIAQPKSKIESWPELKTFHGVMAGTFHPSEEGNLNPIKERSGEMAEKALALSRSKIPAAFDNKGVKEAVSKLVEDSKKLDEIVKSKASDAEITKSLSSLHDVFHQIIERCNRGEEEKEEHHREGQKK